MGFLEGTRVSDHAVFLLVQSQWSWDRHCYAEQGPVGEGEGQHKSEEAGGTRLKDVLYNTGNAFNICSNGKLKVTFKIV